MLSLTTFYGHRDFNNEYFNNAFISEKLLDPPNPTHNPEIVPYYDV